MDRGGESEAAPSLDEVITGGGSIAFGLWFVFVAGASWRAGTGLGPRYEWWPFHRLVRSLVHGGQRVLTTVVASGLAMPSSSAGC
jgi:hypothetical protein